MLIISIVVCFITYEKHISSILFSIFVPLIHIYYEQIELPKYPSHINQIKAKYKGKWGVLNKKIQVLIPFEYHKVSFFRNGIAKVWINKEEYFYITEDGVKLAE